MPLVEQELLTLPENLSSSLVFSEVRVTRSLVLCVWFVDRCLFFSPFSFGHCVVCPLVLFLLAIVLSVLLRFTDSNYPFGVFKHFFQNIIHVNLTILTGVWNFLASFNSCLSLSIWFSRLACCILSIDNCSASVWDLLSCSFKCFIIT